MNATVAPSRAVSPVQFLMSGRAAVCALLFAASACSSGSGISEPRVTVPQNTTSGTTTSDGSNRPSENDSPGVNVSSCTILGERRYTSPIVLHNSSSACDYYFPSGVDFLSSVTVEAGTVVVMGENTLLTLIDGDMNAHGLADQRIVFKGRVSKQGFWQGMRISTDREASLSYVDIMDGGNTSQAFEYYRAGLSVIHSKVSLKNVSVSNSYAHGMYFWGDSQIETFSNNHLSGNSLAGLVLSARLVPSLDEASDYRGESQSNGQPYVSVKFDGRSLPVNSVWKKLNAPYAMRFMRVEKQQTVRLAPGTELLLGVSSNIVESRIWVTDDATLEILGTVEQPVKLGSVSETPGDWHGVQARFGGTVVMDHVVVDGARSGLYVENATAKVSNTEIINSTAWAVDCNATSLIGMPIIELGNGNNYRNNTLGDVNPECPL